MLMSLAKPRSQGKRNFGNTASISIVSSVRAIATLWCRCYSHALYIIDGGAITLNRLLQIVLVAVFFVPLEILRSACARQRRLCRLGLVDLVILPVNGFFVRACHTFLPALLLPGFCDLFLDKVTSFVARHLLWLQVPAALEGER
jgi:hypothetical protein